MNETVDPDGLKLHLLQRLEALATENAALKAENAVLKARQKPVKPVPKDVSQAGWRNLRSQFNGGCLHCKGLVLKGEEVRWKPGEGAVHKSCWGQFWLKQKP